MQNALKLPNFTLYGQFAEIEIEGLKITVNHYPKIACGLATSQLYDVVCFGHNHILSQETVGKTLLLNPGELTGRFGRRTYLILDTKKRLVEVIDVE